MLSTPHRSIPIICFCELSWTGFGSLSALGVVVEGNLVDGAGGQPLDDVLGGNVAHAVAQVIGFAGDGTKVSSEANDVGSGHGSTRDGVLKDESQKKRFLDSFALLEGINLQLSRRSRWT